MSNLQPKRIAIFSDIHANLEALTSVIHDAKQEGCTSFVCLGDVVGYNADPAACIKVIRELGCPVVKGNHDEDSSEESDLTRLNEVAAQAMQWTRKQLNDEEKDWLRSLRIVRKVEGFTAVHSTLDQPKSWLYVRNKYEASSNFSYQFTDLCFHGHTHIPRVFVQRNDQIEEKGTESQKLESGEKYFINVGSVGQPRDEDWRACYLIYDLSVGEIAYRRVSYDIDLTVDKIRRAGLPNFLADRLRQGR